MDAVPAATSFQPLAAPASHGAVQDAWRREVWDEERDRLPPSSAYPIILLLSAGAWALIATVGLWLYGVLG